jgi:hypothetical protein
MELEQTEQRTRASPLSPEQLRAELEAARKEAARYRTQLRHDREAAVTDAEAKRLAEQGEYRSRSTNRSRRKPTPPTPYRNG